MIEYGKTENLLARDPDSHSCKGQDVRRAEFMIPEWWHVTEKIDGTNCRLIIRRSFDPATGEENDWPTVEFKGRSDRANLPKGLAEAALGGLNYLDTRNPHTLLEHLGCDAVTFYGEGYGPGIQKGGGDYGPEKAFAVFDVVTQRIEPDFDSGRAWTPLWWRDLATLAFATDHLGLQRVPVVAERWSLDRILSHVSGPQRSAWGTAMSEGIVARTDPYLYDWRGERVMFKLKHKDLR